MKLIKIVVVMVLFGACGEKRNPDRCCVDEADCAAIGLPNGSTCRPGELCRGNECVEQTCSMSAECDSAAPYCENERCAENCTNDSSCPVTSPAQPYCVSGGCVQCRDTSDCGDLVCRDGRCGNCAADGECASGLCLISAGLCAATTDVAFVSATGSPTSNCTSSAPCTLLRALSIDPPRKTIRLQAGTYQNASTITIEGMRVVVGEDMGNTRITNLGTGPVFVVGTGADIAMERLEIFGATNGGMLGVGVQCTSGKLRLTQVRLANHASDGVASSCELSIGQSTLTGNGSFGARVSGDGTVKYLIERSTVSNNTAGGVKATGGGTIRNVFVLQTAGTGLDLEGSGVVSTRPTVDFVSIGSGGGMAVRCTNDFSGGSIPVTNVVVQGFADNPQIGVNRVCTFSTCVQPPGSPAVPGCTASQALVFLSSDNLHLNPSFDNPAINGASGGTGLLDFDGEQRPKGAAADIGADEVM